MKKQLYITLLMSILLQSCYSYKKIKNSSTQQLKLNKHYKILYKGKQIKGKLVAMDSNSLTIKKSKKLYTLDLKKVFTIQERKFSYLKIIVPIGGIILTVHMINNLDFNFKNLCGDCNIFKGIR